MWPQPRQPPPGLSLGVDGVDCPLRCLLMHAGAPAAKGSKPENPRTGDEIQWDDPRNILKQGSTNCDR